MYLTIKQERLARGWSQQFVANRIHISKQMVHDLENGRRKPSYDVLVKLLNLFGYDDPRKLFEIVENTKRPDSNQATKSTNKE